MGTFPANIATSDQRCFNVDPTLKMKQNPTSDFQRCTTLIQRWYPTRHYPVKATSNPMGLVISMDLQKVL